MYIYEKYILKKLMVVFLLTMVFFTAVLLMFNIFRIARHVAAGLQLWLAVKLFAYLVPSLLCFSIPFGALVSCLLVYGKLSSQNEILALRVNGVSLYRAASAMWMLAVGTFLLALFVFGVVSPEGKYAVRKLRNELGSINPVFLFEPGETMNDFPGYSIDVTKKEGNWLYGISISHVEKEGVTSWIDAKRGMMEHRQKSGTVSLTLYDVIVTMRKHGGPKVWEETDELMKIEFDLASAMRKMKVRKKVSDMSFRELLARSRIGKGELPIYRDAGYAAGAPPPEGTEVETRTGKGIESGENPVVYLTELNKRLVFCFACLSFAMIGAPLGMMVRRGEKTVGISIGITLAMSFYTVVIFAEKLSENPSAHPQLVMWLPNVALVVLGMLFFRRIRRGLG